MAFGAHIMSEKFIIALSALITRKKKRPSEFGVSQKLSASSSQFFVELIIGEVAGTPPSDHLFYRFTLCY